MHDFNVDDIIGLDYYIGGFCDGYSELSLALIAEGNNTMLLKHKPSIHEAHSGEIFECVLFPNGKEFFSKLYSLTEEWASEYDNAIRGGTQWNLVFKLRNGSRAPFYGSNAYPDNWKEVDSLIDVLRKCYLNKRVSVPGFAIKTISKMTCSAKISPTETAWITMDVKKDYVNTRLLLSKNSMNETSEEIEVKFPRLLWNKFIHCVYNTIKDWPTKYSDNKTAGSPQWDLKFTMIDDAIREYSGTGTYPDNWDKYIILLNWLIKTSVNKYK